MTIMKLVLQIHTKNRCLANNAKLEELTWQMKGCTGADIVLADSLGLC
jgi:ATP-dependent 26S proteasome regulatory subunit